MCKHQQNIPVPPLWSDVRALPHSSLYYQVIVNNFTHFQSGCERNNSPDSACAQSFLSFSCYSDKVGISTILV